MKPAILPLVLLLTLSGNFFPALAAGNPAATFHVSPAGNDQNAGTREKPFASLERARDAVRTLKAKGKGHLTQPVNVVIGKGNYVLQSPLVLTPEDSGTKECPVTYLAEPDAQAIISGGRTITGWKETDVAGKKLWTTEVPEVKAGKWYFHQLWVNGERRQRARHPNQGFFKIAGVPDLKKGMPYNQGQNRFKFAPGNIKAWGNLEDMDVVVLHLWVAVRLAVTQVDEKENLVTFLTKSRRRLTEGADLARFYVENALELLDEPGEWYLDRKTGVLYYWPMAGEALATVEATAPVLPHLLRLEGKPEAKQFVEHVAFRGISFQNAEWWPARNDTFDAQAAAPTPGVIQADGARFCSWEHCAVAHAAGYGFHLGRGCQNNRIVGCRIFDLGAGGIKIGEMTVRDDPALQAHSNVATDNHLHDLGKVFHQAVGIWIGQSFGNRVAHNHIHDLYYTGISAGWTWGYGKTLARDNIIEFNHVHDLGKAWLSDMGGIYTLGVQPGTVIRGNIFHDIAGYHYGGWGIYFDEGSTDIVAENNLVYRTTHGGFHQHYGKNNIVRNNIFAFGRDAQVRRSREEPHRSFTFERNIVYWTEGKLLDGNWKKLDVVLAKNLYWNPTGKEVRFAGMTLEQWQAKGMDVGSLIADPLFANPPKNDFRLNAKSPADRIGFVPLDLTRVGPRGEK